MYINFTMNISDKQVKSGKITWPELIPGILLKRYKRFIADVKLANGDIVAAHCPNTGSMKECCKPNSPVYMSYHNNPRRKLKYTLELIKMPTSLVGINTSVPNRLVCKSIAAGWVKELEGYDTLTPEIKISKHSRLDVLLSRKNENKCYVEIKNCTMVKNNIASFPDAVTTRGLKHLIEMQRLKAEGNRCVMFFLIQRMDANIFCPADDIDPAYGNKLRHATNHGVEILVYDVKIDLKTIRLRHRVPCKL
jgi:sugar fermentation stimulation protein A